MDLPLGLAIQWLSGGLILTGCFFFFSGSVGLIRLPDALSRLHALTKADNVGLLLVVLGLLPRVSDPLQGLKLILIWILVMAAGATAANLIAGHALASDPEDAR